jgi:hypothetical protein
MVHGIHPRTSESRAEDGSARIWGSPVRRQRTTQRADIPSPIRHLGKQQCLTRTAKLNERWNELVNELVKRLERHWNGLKLRDESGKPRKLPGS